MLVFNVNWKLTTVFVIATVPKMVPHSVCNQRGLRCEMDEVNIDDRIQWKRHIRLSAPWVGFEPVTSEVTLPAVFAVLWRENKHHSPLDRGDFSRSGGNSYGRLLGVLVFVCREKGKFINYSSA
jgi:hypothetical protein